MVFPKIFKLVCGAGTMISDEGICKSFSKLFGNVNNVAKSARPRIGISLPGIMRRPMWDLQRTLQIASVIRKTFLENI